MTPKEIAALRERALSKRAELGTYRNIDTANRTATYYQSGAQNIGNVEKDAALSQSYDQMPDLIKTRMVASGAAPTTPGEAARLRELALKTGATSEAAPSADLSTDIEGALRRGGTERVAGDQRLVVDATGQPMATRDEYPSLYEHARAFAADPRQGGFLPLFGNALSAPSRGLATLLNAREMGMDVGPSLSAAWEGVKGSTENTVREGGPVARGGSGFGDYLLARANRNPDGTLLDVVNPWAAPRGSFLRESVQGPLLEGAVRGVGGAGELIGRGAGIASEGLQRLLGVDPEYIEQRPSAPLSEAGAGAVQRFGPNRPASELAADPNATNALGEAIGLFADPLNFVEPAGALKTLGRGVAGATRGLGAERAAKALEAVGATLTKERRLPSVIGQHFSQETRFARKLENADGQTGELARETPADAASAAGQIQDIRRQEHAVELNENIDAMQGASETAKVARASDNPLVNALRHGDGVEPIRPLPEIDRLEELRRAAKSNPRLLEQMPTRQRELLEPVLDDARWSQTASAYRETLLAGEGEAAANALLPQSTLDNAFELGNRVKADLWKPHPWASSENEAQRRALSTAKAFTLQDTIDAQRAARAGHGIAQRWPVGVVPGPRVARAPKAVAMEAMGIPKSITRAVEPFLKRPSYDAFARRTMSVADDVADLRMAASQVLPRIPEGHPVRQALEALNVDSQAIKPEVRAEARRVMDGLEPHTGVPAPVMPTGSLEEGHAGLAARGSQPIQRFVEDPFIQAAARRESYGKEITNARIGQRLAEITDTQGRKFVTSLDEALLSPRKGEADDVARFFEQTKDGPQLKQKLAFSADPTGATPLHRDLRESLARRGAELVSPHDPIARAFPALSGKVMPSALKNELIDVSRRLEPNAIESFFKAANRLWMPLVLRTPGFHGRNAVLGAFQVWLAIGRGAMNRELWTLAGDVAAGAAGHHISGEIADLVDEVRRTGVWEGGFGADVGREYASRVRPQGAPAEKIMRRVRALSPLSSEGLFTDETLDKVIGSRGLGAAMGGRVRGAATSENIQRTVVYLHERMAGKSSAEAARQVNKFMFDYTGADLTRLEKHIRNYLPFYNWIKQSTVRFGSEMLRHPDKFAAVNHAFELADSLGRDVNVDPRFVPGYVRESGLVSSPFSKDTGDSLGFVGMERPGSQLSWLFQGARDPAGAAKALSGQLGPIPKMALERATGEYSFGDVPISPTFDPENANAIESLFGMRANDLPGYLARSLGGNLTLPIMSLLGQINPELVNSNPRRTGQDESEMLKNRALSTLLGPRASDVRPLDTAERGRRTYAESRAATLKEEAKKTRRRLGGEP